MSRKYFEAFLKKYKKMPTKDELILFYYNRVVLAGKKGTLPYMTETWAERLVAEYKEVLETNKLTINEALNRLSNSLKR